MQKVITNYELRITNLKSKIVNRKSQISFLLLASCLLLLTGCQQGGAPSQPQPAAASQAKQEAPKPGIPPPAAEVKEEKKQEAAVEIKQRNPFKPFIVKVQEKRTSAGPKTPLQKYELEQFKLIAIIWGSGSPLAMVEAPDGKGYSVKKGDLIGSRGKVKRIEKDMVVVEERLAGAGGEVTTSEFTIKLPLPKGEEELR